MTYCVAIKVDDGIVFASDSRTNAGVDYIRTYSKMYSFVWPDDRVVVVLTSGNLATTQSVINNIEHDLENPDADFNLLKARHLYEVAHYVGKLSQREQAEHAQAFEKDSTSLNATFIVGGQINSSAPEIYLVYPEGNYISASMETPYLQIGENKYGKPILDRVITSKTSLEDAARCSLVSLDSTMRSNISVGPPFELAIFHKDKLAEPYHQTLTVNSTMYKSIQKQWNEGLKRAFQRLPRFEWEK